MSAFACRNFGVCVNSASVPTDNDHRAQDGMEFDQEAVQIKMSWIVIFQLSLTQNVCFDYLNCHSYVFIVAETLLFVEYTPRLWFSNTFRIERLGLIYALENASKHTRIRQIVSINQQNPRGVTGFPQIRVGIVLGIRFVQCRTVGAHCETATFWELTFSQKGIRLCLVSTHFIRNGVLFSVSRTQETGAKRIVPPDGLFFMPYLVTPSKLSQT